MKVDENVFGEIGCVPVFIFLLAITVIDVTSSLVFHVRFELKKRFVTCFKVATNRLDLQFTAPWLTIKLFADAVFELDCVYGEFELKVCVDSMFTLHFNTVGEIMCTVSHGNIC